MTAAGGRDPGLDVGDLLGQDGTLTLNKMTARELMIPGQNRFTVSGEGYGTKVRSSTSADRIRPRSVPAPDGAVRRRGARRREPDRRPDPTEGALIVLGAKGGLDIEETRATYPRIAEVPFDSEYKFMATFHEMTGTDGRRSCRCYVKARRTC